MAAATHHPIIQKKVDELLAKDATEALTGGAGFYIHMYCSLAYWWFVTNTQSLAI